MAVSRRLRHPLQDLCQRLRRSHVRGVAGVHFVGGLALLLGALQKLSQGIAVLSCVKYLESNCIPIERNGGWKSKR